MQTGTKFSYRCRNCSIIYHYDSFVKGNKHFFYDKERHFVKASNVMFIERTKLSEYAQLLLHSQVSFESQAISYNATFKKDVENCEQFFNTIPMQESEEFDDFDADGLDIDIVDLDDEEITDTNNTSEKLFGQYDLGRKQISAATFAFLIEEELRLREQVSSYGFEKPLKNSFEIYMEEVDKMRSNELYPHECLPDCSARGCPFVTSLDGIWKIR